VTLEAVVKYSEGLLRLRIPGGGAFAYLLVS